MILGMDLRVALTVCAALLAAVPPGVVGLDCNLGQVISGEINEPVDNMAEDTEAVIIVDTLLSTDAQFDRVGEVRAEGVLTMADFQVTDVGSTSLRCIPPLGPGSPPNIGAVEATRVTGSFEVSGCSINAGVFVNEIVGSATISNNAFINGPIVAAGVGGTLFIENNLNVNGGISCTGLSADPVIELVPNSLNGVCELECAAACPVPFNPLECNNGAILSPVNVPTGVVDGTVINSAGDCSIVGIQIRGNFEAFGRNVDVQDTDVFGNVVVGVTGTFSITGSTTTGNVDVNSAAQVTAIDNNIGGNFNCPASICP
eukprot:evm.model.scf_1749.1 EVM.evm.TU.scf_1749.1   scf_1749:17628-18676(+)